MQLGKEIQAGPSALSYAGALTSKLAHAPCEPRMSENQRRAEDLRRKERVEPELVAAASHFGRDAEFHSTKARPGEELPNNLYRSSAGFLINKQAMAVKLDKNKVMKEAEFFQKFVAIAYFVGGTLSPIALQEWISNLRGELNEECKLGRDLGNGFFQIISKAETTTQKILMLSPHLSKWGTSIVQPWIPDFNPQKPMGLKLPVWITLKGVRDELLSSAQELAAGIGVVLGRNRNNGTSSDQRFCVAVQAGKPFDLEIVTENPVTGKEVIVQVDYNNLPIRCRLCMSTSHLLKDCEKMTGIKRPNYYQHRPNVQPDPRQPNRAGSLGYATGGSDVNTHKQVCNKKGGGRCHLEHRPATRRDQQEW